MRRLGHVPALDGLRGVAIALVVLYHATDFAVPASGLAGVDLFFVLSGFLITTLLLQEREVQGRVSLGAFYRRRGWRLLPAAFLMLGVFLAVSLAIGDAIRETLAGVAAGVFYCMNFVLAVGRVDDVPFALTHLWSLAAEEQFYLVWPLLLLVALRGRVRAAVMVCVVGVIATQAQALHLLSDHASGHRIAFGVDTRSMPIIVGCLLALLFVTRGRKVLERASRWLEPAAAVLVVALAFVAWHNYYFAGPLLVVSLACCVLIVQAIRGEGPAQYVLALAPVAYLGRISYSLYLWHVPVLAAFGVFGAGLTFMAVPAVAVSLLAAIASYHLVERPLIERARARRRVREAPRQPTPITISGAPQPVPTRRGVERSPASPHELS